MSTKILYNEERDINYIDNNCPKCGTNPILVLLICHTYEQNGKWVSCINCGSAGHLFCDNENCEWSYDWGLNPKNPRSEINEQCRPDWLVGNWPC